MATNGLILGLALVDVAVSADVVAAIARDSSPGSAPTSSLAESLSSSNGTPVVVLDCGSAGVGVANTGGGGVATAGETALVHTL